MYILIKYLHITLAVAAGAALFGRIMLLAIDSPVLKERRIILGFMAIDIGLVALGIALAIMLPNKDIVLANGWLTAKVLAWFAMFGSVFYGIKLATQKSIRLASVCFGFVLYIYIISVAHQHTPWPF